MPPLAGPCSLANHLKHERAYHKIHWSPSQLVSAQHRQQDGAGILQSMAARETSSQTWRLFGSLNWSVRRTEEWGKCRACWPPWWCGCVDCLEHRATFLVSWLCVPGPCCCRSDDVIWGDALYSQSIAANWASEPEALWQGLASTSSPCLTTSPGDRAFAGPK